MFDDQDLNKTRPAPGNLPVSEPEDMFAGTEKNSSVQHDAPPVMPNLSQSSAMGAGKSQPKMSPPVLGDDLKEGDMGSNVQVMPEEMSELNKVKGPTFAKNLMIGIMVLAGVGILGGGSWLVFVLFVQSPAVVEDFAPSVIEESTSAPVVSEEVNNVVEEGASINDTIADEAVLFGEPIDSDSDNLSGSQEQAYNTDPDNWDTDGDGLSDGDEVFIWKSNPLLPDTDGDTYSDGDEVKNGYNPIGPGKIFEVSQ